MKTIVATLALAAAVAAGASTFGSPRTIKCPVGGRSFTYVDLASYSRWGALPDGQPVGSASFPIPIPQCPDNGLVLFDEFDRATVRRLEPLVKGPEYQALRRTETQRYLVQRLQGGLGIGEVDRLWTLLEATWEAKNADEPARAARYNEEFVRRATALADDPNSLSPLALKARAANALRELGRFKEAEALRTSLTVLPSMGGSGSEAIGNRQGWTRYLAELAPVIARRDASRAPIDLIGEREAHFRCVEPERPDFAGAPLSTFERGYCARPELREGLVELRKALNLSPPSS